MITQKREEAPELSEAASAPRSRIFSKVFPPGTASLTSAEVARYLDALPHQAAVLDAKGVVRYVNLAWRRVAEQNGTPASCCGVGVNYVRLCEEVRGPEKKAAEAVAAGLRSVLNHHVAFYELEYPCDAPEERRWFLMQAAPILDEQGGAVVVHVNITDRMIPAERKSDQETRR